MSRLTKPRSAMIAAALATAVTWTQPLSAGQVDITVTGVTAPTGFIMIGVADAAGANEFPYPKTLAANVRLSAQQGEVVKTLTMPPGRFAVAAYHNRDNGGKLETGAFGIPKEPVGFSNHPTLLFGLQSF
ncbi:MAG: DUF2141 domain-containing protein, partial [Pseudomonadota bacterium]|nr:DUF2141 domain-containing protein [Pseudomonadota bacterium]